MLESIFVLLSRCSNGVSQPEGRIAAAAAEALVSLYRWQQGEQAVSWLRS